MGDLSQQQLGELIASENPYGQMTDIDLANVVKTGLGAAKNALVPFQVKDLPVTHPLYFQGFFWTVGATNGATETVRVSKAMRVSYKVNGLPYTVVIGYEGGAGM